MDNIASKEEQKAKAVEILNKLDIYKPYIRGFVANRQRVCFYERFGGYWVDQEPEIESKMTEIEQKYNCTVYAITHEYTEFGELWDFMYVPQYKDDWEYIFQKYNGNS